MSDNHVTWHWLHMNRRTHFQRNSKSLPSAFPGSWDFQIAIRLCLSFVIVLQTWTRWRITHRCFLITRLPLDSRGTGIGKHSTPRQHKRAYLRLWGYYFNWIFVLMSHGGAIDGVDFSMCQQALENKGLLRRCLLSSHANRMIIIMMIMMMMMIPIRAADSRS